MLEDHWEMAAPPAADLKERNAFADSWEGLGVNIRRLALLVFLLNAISSLLFIIYFNHAVYDDPNNFPDVQRYASEGVSVGTIRHHQNPTGPTSFVWMAAGVRLFGSDGLRDARLASLISWVLLGASILFLGERSSYPQLWYAAFLVTLVFPHAVSTSALVLTEGPALLFALLGVLAWLEAFSRPAISLRLGLLGILGGFSLGMAVTCRQYFLALLPAALFFAIFEIRRNKATRDWRWYLPAALSLLAASVPVLMLLFVWKNFSSPGMVAGVSYQGQQARVGMNFFRPLVAAVYAAAYFVPLTFPAMLRLKNFQRRVALLFAVVGAAGITYFSSLILQPGPLNSLIRFASRLPHGGTVLFAAIAIVVLYNAASVCLLLWEQRHSLSSCAPAVFALLVVVFFVAEQIGVGGNLPFYDRYVLQIAPFLGLIAFTVLPRLTPARFVTLAGLSVLSHVMLWRFAFIG
jgi:hypothetical protein